MSTLSFLIAVAPLLLLLASLVLRRYPGEAVIERLRGLVDAVVRPSASAGATGSRLGSARERVPRGGELIARSLAGRAPPVPA